MNRLAGYEVSMKLGEFELNTIYTGDARELAKDIPDESVDLIFTDPVYENIEDYLWLSRLAMRVLKQNKAILIWHAHKFLPEVLTVSTLMGLRYVWQIASYMPTLRTPGKRPFFIKWRSCLVLSKGKVEWKEYVADHITDNRQLDNPDHKWMKSVNVIEYYLRAFTKENEVILEPFTGGGSTLVACKQTKRNYIGFEINEQTAEMTRKRLESLSDPLPFVYHDSYQGSLFCEAGETPANNRLQPTPRGAGKNRCVIERPAAAPLGAAEADVSPLSYSKGVLQNEYRNNQKISCGGR